MGSLTPREELIVIGWVSCSLAALIIILCLFPGLTELRWLRAGVSRLRGRPENRGRRSRHALGGSSAPAGAGGPSGDPEDQETEEDTA